MLAMNDTTEPIPVIALQYHQDDEHAPWLGVVRLLCILCIIGSGSSAVLYAVAGWNYLDASYRTMYARSGYGIGWIVYLGIVQILGAVLSALLVAGAIGCLRRVDVLRRLMIAMCWSRLAFALLTVAGTVGMWSSRSPSIGALWVSVPQVIGRELTGGSVLLAIAIAVILNRPEVRRAFTARGAAITP